jgi:hypothetical protein
MESEISMSRAAKVRQKIGFTATGAVVRTKVFSAPRAEKLAEEKVIAPEKASVQPRALPGSALAAGRQFGNKRKRAAEPGTRTEPAAIVICREPANRRKRVKLAEAFRECGADEYWVAEKFFGLGSKLSGGSGAGTTVAKLLLDLLKVVIPVLEPVRGPGANLASDTPEYVHFVHNVPRPVRTE